MNLEQMIDEIYGEYQADLKAKKEAKNLKEQQETEQAIAQFQTDLNQTIAPDLQKDLGIEICAKTAYVCAEFVYKAQKLKIARWCSNLDWQLQLQNNSHLCGGRGNNFLNLLLLELGKIRDSFEPKSTPVLATEIIEKFNSHYVQIQAIAQSEEWRNLCQVKHNDPEMKTHLGDVLHYLGEAMGCVEEVIEDAT